MVQKWWKGNYWWKQDRFYFFTYFEAVY